MSEIINAIKSTLLLLTVETHNENQFKGYTPVYAFNTDDSSSVFVNHQEYIQDNNVLTVTGSGDAIIDLFLNGAKSVTCFDVNKSAKYFAKLKIASIKSGLNYEDFVRYFHGNHIGDEILTYETYQKLAHLLDKDTRKYWDSIYEFMQSNDIVLKNNNTKIIYEQYSSFLSFPCLNKTLNNPVSYATKANYEKAQKIIQTKTTNDITFIDTDILDLSNKLDNKIFNYIYLSNIMDFTSLFINSEDLLERLTYYKNFIRDILTKYLTKTGIITVSFISDFRSLSDDVFYSLEEYKEVFKESEDFFFESLYPYNKKDHIIFLANKNLANSLKQKQYQLLNDFF